MIIITHICDKCGQRCEYQTMRNVSILTLPWGWHWRKQMDIDGGHTDLLCHTCIEQEWEDTDELALPTDGTEYLI